MLLKEYAVSNDANKYEAWPSIGQFENNDLIITYRTSDTNTHGYDATGHIVARKSTDNGKTWGDEINVLDVSDTDDSRSGALLVYTDENRNEALLQTASAADDTINHHNHLYISKSTDAGLTWTTPVLVSSERVTVTNPIQLSDNSIIIPAYKVLSNDYTVSVFKSTDYGETWTETIVKHSAPLYYNESAIIETSPGNILMITRWDTDSTNFILFRSTDYGETWTDGEIGEFTNYYPKKPNLTRLNGDTILFTYEDSGYNTRFYLSNDEGVNWVYAGMITYDTHQYIVKGLTRSYPSTIKLNNSRKIGMALCTNGMTSDVYFSIVSMEKMVKLMGYTKMDLGYYSRFIQGG